MSASGRVGLEGRCLQRPGSRERLPSKDFDVDDDQIAKNQDSELRVTALNTSRYSLPIINSTMIAPMIDKIRPAG
jgi:hypothetical protein